MSPVGIAERPPELELPFAQHPAPGCALQVAPGVFWVRMPLPLALNHINLWLLEQADGWTVVDCGFNSDETRTLWERVFAACLGGRPIRRLIVTHFHPDHLGLCAWLTRRWDVEVWMTEAEYLTAHAVFDSAAGHGKDELFALFRRHGLAESRIAEMADFGNSYRRWMQELPGRFRRILPDEAIDIGANVWRVVVGHGHAPEHAALYCDALGVMISGDMVLPRITTNVSVRAAEPDGNPLKLFLDSLLRYRALPGEALVLPSHGMVFRGLHSRIDQLLAHHADRLDALKRALTEPATAAAVAPVLFPRELDARQWFFAMGEAIAHLNYLMLDGGVERETGADGLYRFRSTA